MSNPCRYCRATRTICVDGPRDWDAMREPGQGRVADVVLYAVAHGEISELLKIRMRGILASTKHEEDTVEECPQDAPHYWIRLRRKR